MRIFRAVLIIGSAVAFAQMPLFAQDSVGNETATAQETPSRLQQAAEAAIAVADEPGQQTAVPAQEQGAAARNVAAIEVQGNKAISSNTIVSKLKTRVGAPYQETIATDDLKRLYLLGYFEDIKIDTEAFKDGVKVIVRVVERPIIDKVSFSGFRNTGEREDKLKDKVKTRETQYLDYPNLAEDVKTLKGLYERRGYASAAVTYDVDVDEKANRAKVRFSAVEGLRSRIRDIFVRGNRTFSSAKILRLMKTKSAWLFNRGVLKEEVLKEDIERVAAFFRKNGFDDVVVKHEVKPYASGSPLLYITLTIEEGKRYYVGAVTVNGNKDIAADDVRNSLKELLPGKVFSQDALKQDISRIQGLYFDRGYISAQVEEATSVNAETGKVDIVFTVTENVITYVDKIKIRGNVKTRDMVVRRELRIRPGDKFDGQKLKRSRERIQNLGFFEDVGYDIEDSVAPDKKNLIVDVKETKTGTFSFGGGFSTVDEWVGFVEVEQKNFDFTNFPYFTGAGQDLKIRASTGTLTQGFDLSFTEPWLFDYPVSGGFDLYKRQRSREEDSGYGYDEDVTGGDLRFGKELSEYVRGTLVYRYDLIDISDVDPSASVGLLQEEGENAISSFSPGISFDNRDNVFDPRRGDYLTGSIELAGGPLGGDKDYWKTIGRVSHYFPMPRESALEVRLRAGFGNNYGDSERIPIYERFFVGGANTVRGYDERVLGPIDTTTDDPLGGEAMFVGNLEYTYPVVSFLKLAAFLDAGRAWESQSSFLSGDLYKSFGLGVRIKTPIGPIQLDYGIPLDSAPGEDGRGSGKLHFSASHGF